MTESRVPTSERPNQPGWSLETAIDHLLSVMAEKDEHLRTLIAGNDKRYEQRFDASQKALEVGFAAAKAAVDASFAAQKEAINAALAAADRAVTKAELATEKRFESVNEFRGTLDNQQRTLIPRSEVDKMFSAMTEKVDRIQKQADELAAERAGVKGGYGYAVAVVMFIVALISFGYSMLKP
jgi:hypothetical protein